MKQVTLVFTGGLAVSGINDQDELIMPELSEELRTIIQKLESKLDKYKTPEQTAIDGVVRHFKATADDMQLIEHKLVLPQWADLIGLFVATGEVIRHGDSVVRVIQGLDIYEHQPPQLLPAHYNIINSPDSPEPIEWTSGSYAKGTKVTHNGFTWESVIDNNVWEPGAVNETIWKKIV